MSIGNYISTLETIIGLAESNELTGRSGLLGEARGLLDHANAPIAEGDRRFVSIKQTMVEAVALLDADARHEDDVFTCDRILMHGSMALDLLTDLEAADMPTPRL